jgi:hypothetical protein
MSCSIVAAVLVAVRVPLPALSLSNNSVSSAVKFCLPFSLHFLLPSLSLVALRALLLLLRRWEPRITACATGPTKLQEAASGERKECPRSLQLRLPSGTPHESEPNDLNLLSVTSPDRFQVARHVKTKSRAHCRNGKRIPLYQVLEVELLS